MTDEGALRRSDVLTLARVGETSPMIERGVARLAMVEGGLVPALARWTPLIIWPAEWAELIYEFNYEGEEKYASRDVDRRLEDLATNFSGRAFTISDDRRVEGEVTGRSDSSLNYRDFRFEWSLATSSGILKPQISNSVVEFITLPYFEDFRGHATAINSVGDLAGWSNRPDRTQNAVVVLRGAQLTELPNAFPRSVAVDVNNQRQIVGYGWSGRDNWYRARSSPDTQGLLWESNGSPRNLPTIPKSISESGTIIGNSWVEWTGADLREGKSPYHVQRACVWSEGRAALLPIPETFNTSSAEGQNQRGDVVGSISRRIVPLKDPLKYPQDFPRMLKSQPHLMPLIYRVPCVWLRSTAER